jgi:hypothetical protein
MTEPLIRPPDIQWVIAGSAQIAARTMAAEEGSVEVGTEPLKWLHMQFLDRRKTEMTRRAATDLKRLERVKGM